MQAVFGRSLPVGPRPGTLDLDLVGHFDPLHVYSFTDPLQHHPAGSMNTIMTAGRVNGAATPRPIASYPFIRTLLQLAEASAVPNMYDPCVDALGVGWAGFWFHPRLNPAVLVTGGHLSLLLHPRHRYVFSGKSLFPRRMYLTSCE